MIRLAKILLSLSALTALGCGDDSAAIQQPELGIRASKVGAVEGNVGCEKLPYLHGSRALSRYVVDDRFDVLVDSNPESARVRFVSVEMDLAAPIVIARTDLDPDFSREVSLIVDAQQYSVRLVSGCGD